MNQDFDEEFARALDDRGGRTARSTRSLGEGSELAAALDAVDLIWESQQVAPPLELDPTALMLGLVPDPSDALDGAAAGAARKRSRLTLSMLLDRLAARGWDVSRRTAFAWEGGAPVQLPPALITAIAEEVSAERSTLTRKAGPDPIREQFDKIVATPEFQELAQRWAHLRGTTLGAASQALESRALAAVHRGGAPDAAKVIESLDRLLAILERGTGDVGGA